MVTIAGIRFKRVGRVYYFDPQAHTDLQVGAYVVVETSKGIEVGRVVIAPRQVQESQVTEPLKPVLRRASRQDILLQQYYRAQEEAALETCRERVAAHGLPMKMVDADYSFDGSRLTFSFTAEGRVDFRELVKDLASIFKTRIELRQIGARDEAKVHDGLGMCGLQFCCSSWLEDFPTVSIRMAKEQDLPLNPSKITGLCGRLLCCLSYENEAYAQAKQGLPKVGEEVVVSAGRGVITAHNVLKGTATVDFGDGKSRLDVPVEQLPRKGGAVICPGCAACAAPPAAAPSHRAPPRLARQPAPKASGARGRGKRPPAR